MPNNNLNAREIALFSLINSEKGGRYSNLETDSAIKRFSLEGADKALYTALFMGVTQRRITLDFIISHFSKLDNDKISQKVRNILRLSLYQLLYLKKIPERAVVFEACALAKKHENTGAANFVNGVLRSFIREKDNIDKILSLPGKKGLSIKYSYPKWLVSLWQEAYGALKCEEILIAQNALPPLTLRTNTIKISRDELIEKLLKNDIPCTPCDMTQNGILLEKSIHPSSVHEFKEGLFYVQDSSAQLACEMLSPMPGDIVMDLCASPGGKSFSSAIMMKNKGLVRAFDIHHNRLDMIKNGASRLGLDIIEVSRADSAVFNPDFENNADKVICDVPCSGLGVISKKPDIRYKSKTELETLPSLQYKILTAGSRYLKKGGRLLYSTCTLNPKENEEITERFLSENPDFHRLNKPLTVFPRAGKNDGFFIDILVREVK